MENLDELRKGLQEFAPPEAKGARSAREERIIAGFEEIQNFVKQNGRSPQHGEDKDIFERIYAVRLGQLRSLEECRSLLNSFDTQGLLEKGDFVKESSPDYPDLNALRAELEDSAPITELRYVRPRSEIEAAEEIANRIRCHDFEKFETQFKKVESELKSGIRKTSRFGEDPSAKVGQFFILSGQLVFIAEVGEEFAPSNGKIDARLRAIYSNGTESNILRRSLQRALYKDETGRRVSEPLFDNLPLFGDVNTDEDQESGTIYVLRSKSNHPFIAEHRSLIHKIGVTGGKIETRIANAENESTYLLAEVEIVATYKLMNINRVKLENLLHRIFASAQIEIAIQDRFGNPVQPKEWFLVPISVIDEAVQKIRNGSITDASYNPTLARLVTR